MGARLGVEDGDGARPAKDDGHDMPRERPERHELAEQAQRALYAAVEAVHKQDGLVAPVSRRHRKRADVCMHTAVLMPA